jgi:hypothetical protein
VQLSLVERQGRTDGTIPLITRSFLVWRRTVVPLLKEAMTKKRTFLDGFVRRQSVTPDGTWPRGSDAPVPAAVHCGPRRRRLREGLSSIFRRSHM